MKTDMTNPSWSLIVSEKRVLARPAGLWTHICDYVRKGSLLKIEVVPSEVTDAEPSNQALAEATHAPPLQRPQQQSLPTVGTWRYALEGTCGPDGDYASNTNIASLITDKAPVGALIGKIGGSTSGKDDGILIFCVGSFCVLRLSDAQEGALFLTINDSPRGFQDNEGQMTVNVFEGL